MRDTHFLLENWCIYILPKEGPYVLLETDILHTKINEVNIILKNCLFI